MIKYLSKFLYILGGKKRELFVLLVSFIGTSILDTIGIGLVGPYIGLASNPESIYQNYWLNWAYLQLGLESTNQFITLVGIVVIIIFYIKSFLSFRIQAYIYRFSWQQQGELQSKLLHAYLTVPYTFHLGSNTAILTQNITAETSMFCNGVMISILTSIANGVILLFIILLLINTDILATLAIAAIIIFAIAVYYPFRNKIAYWGKEGSESGAEIIRIINHSLGGLKETRVIGCESYFENQMGVQAQRFADSVSSFQAFRLLPRTVAEVLLITFLVGFTSIFIIFNQSTQKLFSVLSIFAVASIRLIPSISQLSSAFSALKNASYSLDKLYFDLKELEKIGGSKSLDLLNNSSGGSIASSLAMRFENEIVLDRVTYRYPNASETAIKDISLSITKGQSIALIGKSGSGKTTLVDVILGLLTPESGNLTVDGSSIYHDVRSWQNLIGYIPQSIFLLDTTIEGNIAFGVSDDLIDPERMNKAIHAAQLAELIGQLPDGIKTSVGERGVRLSGGQRQRIGIARTLYHEREILVLDEATSALDNETEILVSEAIKSLSGTKTMIIIAHRLTTVEHCDYIYLMEKGRIVKSGSYREVVLKEQPFH